MQIVNISKRYKKLMALENINMEINNGLIALLGENGAGKSTLMRIIIGEEKPTDGKVLFENKPTRNNLNFYQSLGYLPQDFTAPRELRGVEYLYYVGTYKGINKKEIQKSIAYLVDILNLNDQINKRVKGMSGGTLRRLGIAQAFLNNPNIVILDEPTAGLDITERRNFKEFISEYSRKNTVIVSTHIVSDIEYIASSLLLIKKGKFLAQGDYKELLNQLQGMVWEEIDNGDNIQSLRKKIEMTGGIITNFKGENYNENRLRYVSLTKLSNKSINKVPELNDYYLWKIGGKLND